MHTLDQVACAVIFLADADAAAISEGDQLQQLAVFEIELARAVQGLAFVAAFLLQLPILKIEATHHGLAVFIDVLEIKLGTVAAKVIVERATVTLHRQRHRWRKLDREGATVAHGRGLLTLGGRRAADGCYN